MVKFAHTVFSLPFALIGFFLGLNETGVGFSIEKALLVVASVFFARNAAMAFNRYIDRSIDLKNPRTANREIPAGKIKPSFAIIFIIVNILLFIATAGMLNSLCLYLSPVAIAIIFSYSYFKRFSWTSHLVLGLSLSIAPVGAYIAATGFLTIVPLLFSLIVLFWVSGFDILYSVQDLEFDKGNKLKSIPVRFGVHLSLIISAFLHALTILVVIYTYFTLNGGLFFLSGAIIFSLMLIYQHFIISPTDFSRINIAFFTTNGIASVIFAIFLIMDLFL